MKLGNISTEDETRITSKLLVNRSKRDEHRDVVVAVRGVVPVTVGDPAAVRTAVPTTTSIE